MAVFTAPIALLADAASFLGSAAIIGSARRAEPPFAPDQRRGASATNSPQEHEFLRKQRLVAAVASTITINNFSRNIALGIAVLYLVEAAGLGPAAVALAFGVGNTGFLVGALIARRATARLGMGPTMQLGVALFGPSMLVFALAPSDLQDLAFTLMLFANGLGIAIHNVNQVTVRQVLTPDHLRARVASVLRLLGFGAVPLGTWSVASSARSSACGPHCRVRARLAGGQRAVPPGRRGSPAHDQIARPGRRPRCNDLFLGHARARILSRSSGRIRPPA